MGTITDTGLVVTGFTFFITSTLLMFTAGIGAATTYEKPQTPGGTLVSQGEDTPGGGSTTFLDKLSQCAAGAIGGLLGILIACGVISDAIPLFGTITTVVNYFKYVFQLSTFQNDEVPGILVALLFDPLIIFMGFVGFSRIRGVSS